MKTSSYKASTSPNLQKATQVLKILSNPNRLAIMTLILGAKRELCVHEISERVGISQSLTSHQLSYLEARGVVESTRYGLTKCYVPKDTPLTRKVVRVIHSLQ